MTLPSCLTARLTSPSRKHIDRAQLPNNQNTKAMGKNCAQLHTSCPKMEGLTARSACVCDFKITFMVKWLLGRLFTELKDVKSK